MWEAIRANKRRSVMLVLLMAVVLVALGGLSGAAMAGQDAAFLGMGIALAVWFVLWLVAVAGGQGVMLSSAKARRIEHDDYPVLFNVVEEMTIASGLPKMPRVYIIDNDAPNAFAVGSEKNCAVAVTSGLLMRLNRDELQGVVAHEIGHIKNHDTRFMVLAGVMMGAIILLADLFVRGMFYGGGRRRGRGGGGGGGAAVLIIVALLFAILAPLLAQLLYFACSRRREYLADASGARFSRYPEGLASALEKIAASAGRMQKVNRALAPMLTVNPLKGAAARSLFSTHPPTEERVRILRSMAGAGYAQYQEAFARATGSGLIGRRTLAEAEPVAVRQPSAEPEKPDLERAREAVDILHRIGGLLFLQCACGLKIKVPPGYKAEHVDCPRCGRQMAIPVAAAATLGAAAGIEAAGEEGATRPDGAARSAAEAKPAEGHSFEYTPGRWQSFRCPCGWTVNLSPNFSGRRVQCPGCGRSISTRPR
jgi:heat shock protein HtpX